jgi:hypothetical protein
MKSRIADGGGYRHYLGQRALESQSIEEKYADELAKAGPEEKKRIYERMADEAMRRAKMLNHKPSAGTLW